MPATVSTCLQVTNADRIPALPLRSALSPRPQGSRLPSLSSGSGTQASAEELPNLGAKFTPAARDSSLSTSAPKDGNGSEYAVESGSARDSEAAANVAVPPRGSKKRKNKKKVSHLQVVFCTAECLLRVI